MLLLLLLRARIRYFADLGFALPERANPADFFVEVMFGCVESTASPPTALHALSDTWSATYASLEAAARAAEADASSPLVLRRPREKGGAATAAEGVSLEDFRAWWKATARFGALDPVAASEVYARCLHTAAHGVAADVTWDALLQCTRTMPLARSRMPTWPAQFRVCLARCLLKRLRTRRRLASQMLTVVALSAIAGGVTGPAPVTDTAMLCATVALFATYATLMCRTPHDPPLHLSQ